MKNRTTHSILSFIAAIYLLIFPTIIHAGEHKIRIIEKNAEVRLKPNEKSLIIKKLPLGAVFDVIETIDNWIKIKLPPDKDGIIVTGYVHKNFVEFVKELNKFDQSAKPINTRTSKKVQLPPQEKIRAKKKHAWAGIKIGMNSSNVDVHGEDAPGIDWESQNHLAIGGFINIDINEFISFRPEIFYLRKGSEYSGTILGTNFREEFNGDYLEMPILTNLKVPTSRYLSLGIFGGPYFALKLSAKRKFIVAGSLDEEDFKEIREQDLGLTFGGGLEYNFGLGIITLDIRYSLGLTNVYEPSESEDITIKTRAFLALMGIGF